MKVRVVRVLIASAAVSTLFVTTVFVTPVFAEPENQVETLENQKSEVEAQADSINSQELICKGWFLHPNTYDCGSFVVNGTAVVGKEKKKPYNR